MKSLSTIQASNATTTMTPVSIESLRVTGTSHSGFKFVPDDIIEIPEELEVFSDHFKLGEEDVVYYLVKMAVNGQTFMVSVATFRKDRIGVDDFVEKYHLESPISRILASMSNDEERMRFLAGKKLRVRGSMQAREYKFVDRQRVSYNADDPSTYQTRFWPIFEEVVE